MTRPFSFSQAKDVLTSEIREPKMKPGAAKVRGGRLAAYGRTDEGRYVTTIFYHKPGGVIRVVTARDMDRSERRYYRQRRRN